jgi:hypothetical protein
MNIELIEAASCEIAEYNATEAGLAELRSRMQGVVYEVATVKGMVVARADRAEVRSLRTGLEAMRKQIKAPALAHARLIDDEAKRITAALLELETPIDEVIKSRELVLENERLARELAERNRVTGIHTRIAAIGGYQARAAMCRTAAQVDALLGELSRTSLTGFDEFSDNAASTHLDAMKRVEAILVEKHAQEKEQARVKAEQDEAAAKMAADRAELDAAIAAQAVIEKRNRDTAFALADKLATERQAFADQQASVTNQPGADEAPKAPVVMRSPPARRAAPAPTPAPVAVVRHAETKAPTAADIYTMCIESDMADQFAKWLCHAAGVSFPPVTEGATA